MYDLQLYLKLVVGTGL